MLQRDTAKEHGGWREAFEADGIRCEVDVIADMHLHVALAPDLKFRCADLRVVHAMWVSQLYHTPEPTLEQLEDWQ